jgi:hypothetical protein
MSRKVFLSLVVASLVAIVPTSIDAQSSTMKTRVWTDTARLATLLSDVQTTVPLSAGTWRTVANEGNALANKVYGHAGGNTAARALATDLRTHVREMRTAAMAGDAAEAQRHAREALPFAFQLIDWAEMATT